MQARPVEFSPESLFAADPAAAIDADALPYGALQLDPDGTILSYNHGDIPVAPFRAHQLVGRNFLRDVAPDPIARRVRNALETALGEQGLNEAFDFDVQYPAGRRVVRVRMIANRSSTWLFLTPMS
jgi:photoactive yellow protein